MSLLLLDMVVADGLELIVLMTILIALSAISYYVLFHPLNRVRVRSHENVALLTLIFSTIKGFMRHWLREKQ